MPATLRFTKIFLVDKNPTILCVNINMASPLDSLMVTDVPTLMFFKSMTPLFATNAQTNTTIKIVTNPF